MSQPTVSGPCPGGQAAAGNCALQGEPDGFTLSLTSGAVCRPAGICTYDCEPAGQGFYCTNSVIVDNEGGRIENRMELVPLGNETYSGICTSGYKHPEGFQCQWVYNVKIMGRFPVK
jgi:hypothetical protein